MTPTAATANPEELAQFARTFGLENTPRILEEYDRYQQRRSEWRPSDGELNNAAKVITRLSAEGIALAQAADQALSKCGIGYPEGVGRHKAAEKLVSYIEERGGLNHEVAVPSFTELEAAWQRLQPRVAIGDAGAKQELADIESAMREARASQEAADAEYAEAEKAEQRAREKGQARAQKLSPRIAAARERADELLGTAAASVADLHRLQHEEAEALREADAPAGRIEAAQPKPHRVIEGWVHALRVAGLPVRGTGRPFSESVTK